MPDEVQGSPDALETVIFRRLQTSQHDLHSFPHVISGVTGSPTPSLIDTKREEFSINIREWKTATSKKIQMLLAEIEICGGMLLQHPPRQTIYDNPDARERLFVDPRISDEDAAADNLVSSVENK